MTSTLSTNAGLHMTSDHWYYFGEQGPLPSVTKILGIIDKPALATYKAKEAVRAVLMDPDAFIVSRDDPTWATGLEERLREALRAANKPRDTAAQLGSSVHLLADMATRGAETAATGFEVSEAQRPYLEAFQAFLGHYSASQVVSSEKAVISFGDQYAGTYDLLMQIDGELWLIDIKTSKGIYAETGLQLVAYGYAEHIVLPNDPTLYPMPKIAHYAVLHLRPDAIVGGWRLVEYAVGERDYVAFLAARELWGWQQEGRFKSL